jgi:ABC-type nitrate/sulfonate/bicarbonate transport system substrate-binding protein
MTDYRRVRPIPWIRFLCLACIRIAVVAAALFPLPTLAEERPMVMAISERIVYGVSPTDAAVAIQVWAREVAASAGLSVASQKVSIMSPEAISASLRARTVDLASMSLDEFRRVEQFVDPRRILSDGGSELLLLVNEAGGIKDVSALKGRRLIIHDNPHTLLADAWLTVLFAAHRLGPPAIALSRLERSTRPAQAVLPVFFGQADACVASRRTIETLFELNPQMAKKLKVLQASPKLIAAVVAVRRDLPAEVKDEVFRKLSLFSRNPSAQQAMTLFQSTTLSVFSIDVLRPGLTLIADAERLSPSVRAGAR